jgi:hypothetical protein
MKHFLLLLTLVPIAVLSGLIAAVMAFGPARDRSAVEAARAFLLSPECDLRAGCITGITVGQTTTEGIDAFLNGNPWVDAMSLFGPVVAGLDDLAAVRFDARIWAWSDQFPFRYQPPDGSLTVAITFAPVNALATGPAALGANQVTLSDGVVDSAQIDTSLTLHQILRVLGEPQQAFAYGTQFTGFPTGSILSGGSFTVRGTAAIVLDYGNAVFVEADVSSTACALTINTLMSVPVTLRIGPLDTIPDSRSLPPGKYAAWRAIVGAEC